MRTRSGLVSVVRALRAFFQAHATAAVYGAIGVSIALVGGNATFSAGATTPVRDYDVRVTFDVGGTVGTPGIAFRTSLDAGETWSDAAQLGTSFTLNVYPSLAGISISLSAGTIASGQVVSFTTEGARRSATLLFGRGEMQKQNNQGIATGNRIVIAPGDDGGKDGPLVGAQRLGRTPTPTVPPADGIATRPLFDWERVSIVSIWGVDPARPFNEEASVEVCEQLWEDLQQAVKHQLSANGRWGTPIWTTPAEQQFGQELRVPLFIRTTFFDIPTNTMFPGGAVARNPTS